MVLMTIYIIYTQWSHFLYEHWIETFILSFIQIIFSLQSNKINSNRFSGLWFVRCIEISWKLAIPISIIAIKFESMTSSSRFQFCVSRFLCFRMYLYPNSRWISIFFFSLSKCTSEMCTEMFNVQCSYSEDNSSELKWGGRHTLTLLCKMYVLFYFGKERNEIACKTLVQSWNVPCLKLKQCICNALHEDNLFNMHLFIPQCVCLWTDSCALLFCLHLFFIAQYSNNTSNVRP